MNFHAIAALQKKTENCSVRVLVLSTIAISAAMIWPLRKRHYFRNSDIRTRQKYQGIVSFRLNSGQHASRPKKRPVCGVGVAGQCEGNNREDEVGVLCDSEVSGGSSNVRNMACARDDECFVDKAHKEHCNVNFKKLEPRAREKFARVNACEVSVLCTPPVARKGIAILCKRNSSRKQ